MKFTALAATILYGLIIGILFQNKPLEQSIEDGALIYKDFCLQCHMAKGKGVPGSFPPLAQSDYLKNNLTKSIQAIKYGMRGPIKVNGEAYDGSMVAQGLDDEEVADVLNYILNNWGNNAEKQIFESEVSAISKP